MSKQQILWGEGLFLRPQHFQMQDIYHNHQRSMSMKVLHPYAYGIIESKLDKSLLESNVVSFEIISCVFPDGTLYQAPYTDILPKSVSLHDLNNNLGDEVYVFLNLEVLQLNGSNIQLNSSENPTRYTKDVQQAQDLYTDATESTVDVLRLSPSIVLNHTSSPKNNDALSILIAKLERTPQGTYHLIEDYLVSSVHIESNTSLLNQVSRLMTMINTKSTSLYDHHRQTNNDLLEFRSSDIASFWLLHALNSAYAQLSHLYHNPKLHPERLYEALLNVASQLATFSSLYKVGDLPSYNHNQTHDSFNAIFRIIRELLNTVIASNFISIPLHQSKPSYYVGELSGDKITRNSQLYLSVSCSLPMHELIDIVPRRFKIATPDGVEKRVLSALPGTPISHITQVPSAIPVRPGFSYFSIEPVGEIYNEMIKAESICIYVPNGFDDLKLELMAVVQ